MSETFRSFFKVIAFASLALGLVVLINPTFMEELIFPFLGYISIGIGATMTFLIVRARGSISHPIFTGLIGVAMIGIGVYAAFYNHDPHYGGVIFGGLCVAVALWRLSAYYKNKGTTAGKHALLWCFLYWLYSIFITKTAGEDDMGRLLTMIGVLFVIIAGQMFLSLYKFHDM